MIERGSYWKSLIPRDRSVAKRSLVGGTVTCFDCRGCMSEDHQFFWIGEITSQSEDGVYVRVLKRNDKIGDVRDDDLGEEFIPFGGGFLQEIAKNALFYYI